MEPQAHLRHPHKPKDACECTHKDVCECALIGGAEGKCGTQARRCRCNAAPGAQCKGKCSPQGAVLSRQCGAQSASEEEEASAKGDEAVIAPPVCLERFL